MPVTTSGKRTLDVRELRRTLGQFPTGVTVVTYSSGDECYGATVNSFTSVSLEPPVILVSLAHSSRAAAMITDRPFAVNVLRHDHETIALQFAGKPQPAAPVEWDLRGPAPRLRDSIASFCCRPWAIHEAGDHLLVLGLIEEFDAQPGDALVFHQGAFKKVK